MNSWKMLIPLMVLTVIGTGFFLYFNKNSRNIISTVGEYEISSKSISQRDQIINLYNPGNKSSYGEMQLTKYFKMAAIMKKYGQPVTHEILEKEAERIEENTQRPEWLKKIKDMFQGDHNAYLRVFVLPVYVERSLYYDLFVKSKIIQKEPFERVQSFHQQVLSDGTSFVESAKKTEAKIIPLKVSYEDGVQWGDPKEKEPTQNVVDQTKAEQKKWMDKMARSRPSETAEVDRWVKDILTPLKPGMVSARLIDNETSWSVIKLVKKSGQKNTVYQLEAAVFPKLDWGAWIASELDSTE